MAKKRLTITLSPAVLEYLENTAKEKGLSKSAVITVALEEYKKGQKKHKKRAILVGRSLVKYAIC